MKTSPLIFLLALSLAATSVHAMTVASVSRAPKAEKPASDASKDAEFESFCLQQTGSRVTSERDGSKRCVGGSGRVYTRQDLDRTGETDMAAALRKLDPAIH